MSQEIEDILTEDEIKEMLENRQYKELKEQLESNMYPVDLAEILEDFDQKQLVMIFRLLAKEEAAETFTYMNSDMREILINALTDSELEEVMEEMYLDDTVDVLEEMPANVVDRLLMVTDEETRVQINQLLQYPEDSAGSIMNVEYIASLMEKRRALYAGACDISVSTDGKTPEQIAMEILAAAGEM